MYEHIFVLSVIKLSGKVKENWKLQYLIFFTDISTYVLYHVEPVVIREVGNCLHARRPKSSQSSFIFTDFLNFG